MKGCYNYKINSRDVDSSGRAALTAVCHYVLEAAGEDADLNGFGVVDLNCDNCSWVLSRIAIEIGDRPAEGDTFTVRTWVNEVSRVMTTRNMIITGAGGEPIGAAVTQWAIIDLDKRTAVDIRSHVDYEGAVTDEPSPIDKPRRLTAVEPQHTMLHKVVDGDIDFNRHMNSLRYLELMTDMLPAGYIEHRGRVRLDLAFIREALYGQMLSVGYRQEDDSLFEISTVDGEPLCRGTFNWCLPAHGHN